MTTEELKEKGKNTARGISDIVNYSSGTGIEGFFEEVNNEMSKDHRTLQQSYTRMCLQWLEQVAERKGPQFTDARNESSQKISEQLMDGFVKTIANQQNISEEEVRKNWDVYKPSKWLPHI